MAEVLLWWCLERVAGGVEMAVLVEASHWLVAMAPENQTKIHALT